MTEKGAETQPVMTEQERTSYTTSNNMTGSSNTVFNDRIQNSNRKLYTISPLITKWQVIATKHRPMNRGQLHIHHLQDKENFTISNDMLRSSNTATTPHLLTEQRKVDRLQRQDNEQQHHPEGQHRKQESATLLLVCNDRTGRSN